jgi:hypothetical protein
MSRNGLSLNKKPSDDMSELAGGGGCRGGGPNTLIVVVSCHELGCGAPVDEFGSTEIYGMRLVPR